jgi:hypothetical protein
MRWKGLFGGDYPDVRSGVECRSRTCIGEPPSVDRSLRRPMGR